MASFFPCADCKRDWFLCFCAHCCPWQLSVLLLDGGPVQRSLALTLPAREEQAGVGGAGGRGGGGVRATVAVAVVWEGVAGDRGIGDEGGRGGMGAVAAAILERRWAEQGRWRWGRRPILMAKADGGGAAVR